MFRIHHELAPSWNRRTLEVDLSSADEVALRYSLVLGDVSLVVDDLELGANCGWVPLIDFAACLLQIAEDLTMAPESHSTFEFTESDAVIRFERHEDVVVIDPSYLPHRGSVPLNEFQGEVKAFVSRLRRDLADRFPGLGANRDFIRLLGGDG